MAVLVEGKIYDSVVGKQTGLDRLSAQLFGLDSARCKSTEMTTQIAQSVPFDFP